jgi:hypothetical protein
MTLFYNSLSRVYNIDSFRLSSHSNVSSQMRPTTAIISKFIRDTNCTILKTLSYTNYGPVLIIEM